ncbi:DUF7146 domain-containing protein [Sphingobium cyanobacteriorum]|jgi:hypothetical protein|uniref:DUF7146 domain-containing protein n=1 Tax=Sphingobium cyanobacteriorum TaxID=3063954 RepID=UPI000B11B0FC
MPYTALKPSQELVDIVGSLGGVWHGYVATCRCPAHVDRTPSLSLRQGDRGILVTCFAGCEAEDVLREIRRIPVTRRFEPPKADIRRGTGNVERLWEQARDVMNTLGDRYLHRRHIAAGPADLRFHPRCPLGPKGRTVFKPALLVGVREGHRLVAFQRIFLDPATADYECKVMLGQPGQGGLVANSSG